MEWTNERIELLRKLWSDGLSGSQIAKQLGGITRNSVIGKVHRLKLPCRSNETTRLNGNRNKNLGRSNSRAIEGTTKKTTSGGQESGNVISMKIAQGESKANLPALPDEPTDRYSLRPIQDVVIPISRRLLLVQLVERDCKWPNGDPSSEDFSFCGVEATDTGPYCSYHSKIAYQPPAVRRRSR